MSTGTQFNYNRYVTRYFDTIMDMKINEITPSFVDTLLERWRASVGVTQQSRVRVSFDHELSVLRTVLKYYLEYYDDPNFRYPIKNRHAKDAILKKSPPRHKDLTEDEFLRFREELRKRNLGKLLADLATVQYYEALRISEVAALCFEDLRLDLTNPRNSTIMVCRHVVYPRTSEQQAVIAEGFKNASGGEYSIKELPLWPEAFEVLKAALHVGARGLIFGRTSKIPLSYSTIQSNYNAAFKKVGLPYRSTHVMRHGGCRRVYNATNGDLAIAQQLLGNTDMESTLVYAKRDKRVFGTTFRSFGMPNPNEICVARALATTGHKPTFR